MIAELFLGLITLGTLVAFCFYVYNDRKEHSKMINAIKSQTPQELFNLEMTDKVKVDQKPELFDTPIEDINDEDYLKIITKEANGQE